MQFYIILHITRLINHFIQVLLEHKLKILDIQSFELNLQFVLENNNKAFRQMFRDQIKGNFLIEIKMQIIHRLGSDFMKCYDFQWNFQDILTGKNNPPEYDICRFIIGIHHAHSIFLAKDKIRENEKNTQYKEQLIHEIIEKIRLHQSFYKSCHANTHGSTQMVLYPELHYFEISIMLYYTIRDTFLFFCNEQNVAPTINGIDLISILDKDFNELYQQYQKRSTENFKAEQNKTLS